MELIFRRDGKYTYMIPVHAVDDTDSYILHMLLNNEISGFLPVHIFNDGSDTLIGYDITDRQSLADRFQDKSMSAAQMKQLFSGICLASDRLKGYLLNPADIFLSPDGIYRYPETDDLLFACCPGYGAIQKHPGRELAEFILRHLDHADRQAVELGYAFYQGAEQDGADIAGLIEQIFRQWDAQSEQEAADGTECQPPQQAAGTVRRRIEKIEIPADEEEEDVVLDDKILLEEEKQAKKKRKRKKEGKADGQDQARVHRKRTNASAKLQQADKKRRMKMYMTVGISAAAILFGLSVWLLALDLTQTGGLAFLLISGGWLICRTIASSEKGVKNHWKNDTGENDEEEAFIAQLMQEVYDTDGNEPAERLSDSNEDAEEYGHTRILKFGMNMPKIILVSQSPVYPDLKPLLPESLIGRQPRQADLVLPQHPSVSRVQAKLECTEAGIFITDMQSTNGTFVNQRRIYSRTRVFPGDIVGLAALTYQIKQV